MAIEKGLSPLRSETAPLVSELAELVLANLSKTSATVGKRFEVATSGLLQLCIRPEPFDTSKVIEDLYALNVEGAEIVDICVPAVARTLGEAWLEDEMPFFEVSLASSRLFGLCKALGESWDNARPSIGSRSCMVVSFEQETHLLGPAVMSDQLRRRGHSVTVMSGAPVGEVVNRLADGKFDCLLVSVASLEAYKFSAKAIEQIKGTVACSVPVFLGGAVLEYVNELEVSSVVDLVTSDIDVALDELTRIEEERGLLAEKT